MLSTYGGHFDHFGDYYSHAGVDPVFVLEYERELFVTTAMHVPTTDLPHMTICGFCCVTPLYPSCLTYVRSFRKNLTPSLIQTWSSSKWWKSRMLIRTRRDSQAWTPPAMLTPGTSVARAPSTALVIRQSSGRFHRDEWPCGYRRYRRRVEVRRQGHTCKRRPRASAVHPSREDCSPFERSDADRGARISDFRAA